MRAGSRGMTGEQRLVLWTEGSRRTGLGHLMRQLALGQAWLDTAGPVLGLLGEAPDSIERRYTDAGLAVQRIDRKDGAETLARVLGDDPTARAAIDLPTVDQSDLDRLGGAAARTLLVDDMASLDRYPVALVLNQNAHADRSAYPPDGETRFLLGLRYVLLRREFRRPVPPRRVPDRARHVLITFGGADPTRMTSRTVMAVCGLPPASRRDLELRVVVGAANEDISRIREAAQSADIPVSVEQAVDDMVTPMAWSDLTVTSGGTTVWELARLGCPAIVVETGPSEVDLSRGLERLGLFDRLGPADRLGEERLRAAIDLRLGDRAWRAEMSERGSAAVDGQGATRVVDALAALDAR
jgi:UDP-2,4-diacetamido-2,4,6-trideoxy-beta-L-altropyranose hydrolase